MAGRIAQSIARATAAQAAPLPLAETYSRLRGGEQGGSGGPGPPIPPDLAAKVAAAREHLEKLRVARRHWHETELRHAVEKHAVEMASAAAIDRYHALVQDLVPDLLAAGVGPEEQAMILPMYAPGTEPQPPEEPA
jgi:hypothetical protein